MNKEKKYCDYLKNQVEKIQLAELSLTKNDILITVGTSKSANIKITIPPKAVVVIK